VAKRRTSSGSTIRIIGGLVLVLAVLVLAVYLFAPGKPPPPPRSAVRYEAPQSRDTAPQPAENTAESLPGPLIRQTEVKPVSTASAERESAAAEKAEPTEAGTLTVSGVVVSGQGRQPLPDITVEVAVFDALMGMDERLGGDPAEWKKREMYGEGRTDAEGKVTISVPLTLLTRETGVCLIHAEGQGYGRVLSRKSFTVAEDQNAEVNFELSLDSESFIEGKVTVEGTGEGVPEIVVSAAGPAGTVKGTTDDQGSYRLTGLTTGEYSVAVEYRNTEYRPGKTLPFRKVKISRGGDTVRNVDFSLERAGIVWGYVLGPDGSGVGKANVMLCTSDSPFSQMLTAMSAPESVLNAFTQDDGYYELHGVPLNREWRLYATSPNHSPQLADPFVLTAKADAVRIDIFLFSGSTIQGVVVDNTGRRVADAEVICAPAYGRLFQPNEAPIAFKNTRSDDQGTFTITEVPPGDYQLLAVKEGFRRALRGVPVYSDGYSQIQDVRLELESAEQGDHQIYGVVVDDRGQGLDGAQVRLVAGGMEPFEKVTSTAGGGRFQFDGLAPGYYMLTVTMDGFSPLTVRRVRLDQETRVAMRRSATVRGVVRVRSGQLPPTYTVRAYLLADEQGRSGIPAMMSDMASNEAVFSDPSGAFQMQLNAGAWRLEAVAEGYAPARVEITLEAGQIMDGVELVLNESGGIIAGVVVAVDGGNLQGTMVTLVEADGTAQAMLLASMTEAPGQRTTQVGEDGSFRFDMLPAGDYIVIARHPRYATGMSEPISIGEGDRRENVRVRIGYGGSIEGVVYREGAPVPGAAILIAGSGNTRTATTDASGFYRVENLSPGIYQAMVTDVSSGSLDSIYGAQGRQVMVEEGKVSRCDFGQEIGGRIEGTCVPGPGNLLGGRVVLNMPGANPLPLGAMADLGQLMGQSTGITPAGTFTLTDVPPGDWQLDIYYFEFDGPNPLALRYVHTELVSVDAGANLTLNLPVAY